MKYRYLMAINRQYAIIHLYDFTIRKRRFRYFVFMIDF